MFRIVHVDETLAKFLGLGERYPHWDNKEYYSDILVTSYLLNWAHKNNRVDPSNRKVLKLGGEDDLFGQLFKEDLDREGFTDSIPWAKTMRILCKHYPLDENGRRIVINQSERPDLYRIMDEEIKSLDEAREQRHKDLGIVVHCDDSDE